MRSGPRLGRLGLPRPFLLLLCLCSAQIARPDGAALALTNSGPRRLPEMQPSEASRLGQEIRRGEALLTDLRRRVQVVPSDLVRPLPDPAEDAAFRKAVIARILALS